MDVYVERGITQDWIDKMGMTAHKKEDGFSRDFTWLVVSDSSAEDDVHSPTNRIGW